MQVFVDSSFLVALLNQGDKWHQRAKEIITQTNHLDLFIDQLIKCETLHVIDLKYDRKDALEFVDWLKKTHISSLEINQKIWKKAIDIYQSNQKKNFGNIFDCIHFACMREYNLEYTLTFDKHFEQAGFKILGEP